MEKKRKKDTYFDEDASKTDLKKRSVKSGAIAVLSRLINNFVQIVGTIVQARILTPEDFGLVAMVVSLTGFASLFKDLGLSDATLQKDTINHEQINTLFWINAGFGVCMMLVIVAIAPGIAWFYGEPKLQLIAVLSSLSFAFTGLSPQHFALLKRNMLFYEIALIEISASVLSVLLSIIMAVRGFGYWSLVWRPVFYEIAASCGAWILCRWKPGAPHYDRQVNAMLGFGVSISGRFFVNYFSMSIDKILIGWQNGAKELGFYNKAYQLLSILNNLLSVPLHSVAVPALSKLNKEPEKYRNYYINALSAISFFILPVIVFAISMSDKIILLLLGPQWEKTGSLFAILGFRALIQYVYVSQGWLHVSLGRPDRWFKWTVISSSLTSLAILAGIPFGSVGVAAGYTIILYILIVPGLTYAGKPVALKFTNILSALYKYYIAALVSGLIFYNFYSKIIYFDFLIIDIVIKLIIYAITYFLFTIIVFNSTKQILKTFELLNTLFKKNKA